MSKYAWRIVNEEVPKRTGRLKASLDMHVSHTKGSFTIHAHAPYSRMIEIGTGGGDLIKPKRRKYLRYPDGKYGAKGPWKFSKVVVRGRVKPNPFMKRTRDRLLRWLHGYLCRMIRRLARP